MPIIRLIIKYVREFVTAACEGVYLALFVILCVLLAILFFINIQLLILTFIVGSLTFICAMGAGMKWE